MRSRGWRGLVAATLGLFAIGADAQTGTVIDLGTLLSQQKNLTTFYSLIQKYPNILLQLPSYSGVTILAPNNDAFNKIPYTQLNTAFANNDQDTITNVLQYHILQGTRIAAQLVPGTPSFIPTLLTSDAWTNVTGGQRVQNVKQAGDVVVFVSGLGNRCTVVQSDLMFTGGVVQVIDSLLIPPANITATTASFGLTAFEGAMYTAKTMESTTAKHNVTIFAPANEAFLALGPAISSMTSDELATIMDYHILPQVVYSTGLTNDTKYLTEEGSDITVLQSGNNIYINSAQILQTDVLIANGVLHVIDNVLNPNATGVEPNPSIATQEPVYASATTVSSLPFTSAIPCTSNCPVTSTSAASTTSGVTKAATTSGSETTSVSSSSSKAAAAAMARETGFAAAGLVAVLGGAAMLI